MSVYNICVKNLKLNLINTIVVGRRSQSHLRFILKSRQEADTVGTAVFYSSHAVCALATILKSTFSFIRSLKRHNTFWICEIF